jgi:lipoprotein-releasing system permease protein
MVLTVVSSVMGGFSRDMRKVIRGMQSHIVITGGRNEVWITEYDKIIEILNKDPLIRGASPRIEYPAWQRISGIKRDIFIMGIDPELEMKSSDLPMYFKKGEKKHFNFEYDDGRPRDKPGMVVGSDVTKQRTRNFLGQEVHILSAKDAEFQPKIVRGEFEVVGYFTSGMFDYDYRYVFVHLHDAQKLLKAASVPFANHIAINIHDYEKNKEIVKKKIIDAVHQVKGCVSPELHEVGICHALYIQTWEEVKENLLNAVANEKVLTGVIIFFIIIVAGFNIIAIYTLMVSAKTKDIGILKALGATEGGCASIFLISGTLCGLLGLAIGVPLGLLLADNLNGIVEFVESSSRQINMFRWYEKGHWIIQNYTIVFCGGLLLLLALVFVAVKFKKTIAIVPSCILALLYSAVGLVIGDLLAHPKDISWPGFNLFPKNIYYLERIPSEIHPETILFYIVLTFVVCLVFSIYPAVRAARLDPVEAIRRE